MLISMKIQFNIDGSCSMKEIRFLFLVAEFIRKMRELHAVGIFDIIRDVKIQIRGRQPNFFYCNESTATSSDQKTLPNF